MLADEIPAAVQWYEGMLLAPQHFQQNAARQEMLVQYSALLVGPYCWGVRRLTLDVKLLPAGSFRVIDLEAVMPDGTVVAHRPETQGELTLDLTSRMKAPGQGDLTIHLVLPVRTSSGVKGAISRTVAVEGEPVADENTGEGDLRVARLSPKLSLLEGDTPPPKYVSMPLAKVRFEDEAYVLTDYIPPATAVPARSPLGEWCGQLVVRLREKAMFVSEQVRSPSAVLDMPLLMENRFKMQCLVAGLPQFEAILATGTAHPFLLYVSLCQLAGHLAALGPSLLPPVLSPYQHHDPRASFQEVMEFALRMTNEGIPETYRVYPFALRGEVFELVFDPEWATHRLVLGMRTATGVTEREMITWGEECVIGSESVTPSLRDKRILGAARQFVETDQELVPVRGVILFSLRPQAEFVKPGEVLQVMNFGERGRGARPLEVVLYVKHGR